MKVLIFFLGLSFVFICPAKASELGKDKFDESSKLDDFTLKIVQGECSTECSQRLKKGQKKSWSKASDIVSDLFTDVFGRSKTVNGEKYGY